MDAQKYFDQMFMAQALALAKKAWGSTGINPRVGAMIVKNNRLVSQGYHRQLGEAHAEICALAGAGEQARGATLYVNLEPCCCSGRTPPCVVAIIKAGIKRVVIGMKDPNPLVNGKGIEYLQAHNIKITKGILKEQAHELNVWYKKYITTKIPYTIMKIAISQDGKIAGSAQKYITSESSRRFVHALRGQLNAVLVGIKTILIDNPYLTDRLLGKNNPVRIVIDPNLEIPEHANFLIPDSQRIIITNKQNDAKKIKVLTDAGAEFIFLECAPYPTAKILEELGKQGIGAILIEGGGEVFTHFFKTQDYDELYLFKTRIKIIKGLALDKEIINYVQTRDKKPINIGEDLLYHVHRNN
ncbi:MAG: bifunctional diaminohydroxyphosphoribosylaminopyrimidine deaminase/5-amino-6-(5-phosphoribosylamino)uracil reductase RibD [bacterium]